MGTIASQILRLESPNTDDSSIRPKSNKQQSAQLMFVGTADSGKTTIFRQIQMRNGGAYSPERRLLYRHIIHYNIIELFEQLLLGCIQLSIDTSAVGSKFAQIQAYVAENRHRTLSDMRMTDALINVMIELWRSDCIQQCAKQANRIDLLDNCEYFLNNLKRITASDYVPTELDILRSSGHTIGIDQFELNLRPQFPISVIDIGGTAVARRKWSKMFNNLAVLFYVCDLSGYCRTITIDNEQATQMNCLLHSLSVFAEIVEDRLLVNTQFVVLLNKTDLFEHYLMSQPLANYITEFDGPNDTISAQDYVRSRFLGLFTRKSAIYTHLICAISGKSVDRMISDTLKVVMKKSKTDASTIE